MNFPTCALWILTARTDIPFMMQTIPHLIRMSNFPFTEKVLAIDTAPLTGDKINRPGVGTMEQLRDCTQQLLDDGVVDRVVDVNYDPQYQQQVYLKHFGTPIWQTHNYKGYPILGTIFTIEEPKADYLVHFDSDMLLYQNPDYSWIEAGIKLMERRGEIMSIRPLTGPPKTEGEIYQEKHFTRDEEGFFKFKFFSSRVYLIKRQRFEQLLPMPIIWRRYRQAWLNYLPLGVKNILNYLTKKGKIDSWEIMVSAELNRTHYFRCVLDNPKAWTLHPKDRSPEFIAALPHIIAKIEAGEYPQEQAGHYDLISSLWI
jgi:hypothetical protein